MSFFMISGADFSDDGEPALLVWAAVDPVENRFLTEQRLVSVDRIVEALDRGDIAAPRFQLEGEWVPGKPIVRKVLPGGDESIADDPSSVAGKRLTNLLSCAEALRL